ncbi:hypothetical protein C4D60_Mb04t38380 [Musa balbisiana]|uniref:Uncharacterized protein n=1 Tax=Musa balbisiana TaxID=52838 RepID=A0A4S8KHQ3_MUSBA|nr:hypothetical protein C4D60_Mb04t38380 [Musa balbisiana]
MVENKHGAMMEAGVQILTGDQELDTAGTILKDGNRVCARSSKRDMTWWEGRGEKDVRKGKHEHNGTRPRCPSGSAARGRAKPLHRRIARALAASTPPDLGVLASLVRGFLLSDPTISLLGPREAHHEHLQEEDLSQGCSQDEQKGNGSRHKGCGTRDRFAAVRGLLFLYALHLNDLLRIILSVYCYLQASHQEKKLVAEIKKTAQTGNEASFSLYLFFMRGIAHCYLVHLLLQAATRILARQLVRLRQQITNLQGTRAQIRGIATHTQAMYANTSLSTGMKGASKAMAAMNKVWKFNFVLCEAIDETLDKDEAEEETEELTNQVLDEIGVDVASQLSSAPKGRIAVSSKKVDTASRTVAPKNPEVDDLEKRLASLRRI